MKTTSAFLKPISINAFKHPSGLNGKIIGVVYVTPDGLNERLCYKIHWGDMDDYVPISDVVKGMYEIVKNY